MSSDDHTQDSDASSLSTEQKQLLLQEYDGLFRQIFHWDNLLWKKYRFFLLIESAFVAGGLEVIRSQVLENGGISTQLAGLFLFASGFNLFISYVWFRTSRRNQEYLDPRFIRLLEIEEEVDDMLNAGTYTYNSLSAKGSAEWELHLSTGFLLLWYIVGAVFAYFISLPLAIVWIVVLLLISSYLERGLWFRIPRTRQYENK